MSQFIFPLWSPRYQTLKAIKSLDKKIRLKALRNSSSAFIKRKDVRDVILEKCGYRCVTCNAIQNLTIDHIVPIVKGGVSIERNIQTLCFKCNQQKGCKTPLT